MKIYEPFNSVRTLYNRIKKHEVTATGAELTYYLILSFFPFLIFLITLASFFPITGEDVLSNLARFLPYESYKMVIDIINEILDTRSTSLLSVGMIATIWTASKGLKAIIRGINKAYNERENRAFWKTRVMAILFTIALAIAIIFSFIAIVFGKLIASKLFTFLGFPIAFNMLWSILRYAIPLACLFVIFVFIYIYAPNCNCRLTLKHVYPGALFSTFGWIFISIAFSYYVNNFNSFSKAYGSIGGIIVLLIWLYISSIIILIGGEINASLYFSYRRSKPSGFNN